MKKLFGIQLSEEYQARVMMDRKIYRRLKFLYTYYRRTKNPKTYRQVLAIMRKDPKYTADLARRKDDSWLKVRLLKQWKNHNRRKGKIRP